MNVSEKNNLFCIEWELSYTLISPSNYTGAQPWFKSWGTSMPKAPRFDAEGVDCEIPKASRE